MLDQETNLWRDGVDNRMKNWESEILNDISRQEEYFNEYLPGNELFEELNENEKKIIDMKYLSNSTLYLQQMPDYVSFDYEKKDIFKKILLNKDLPFEFDEDDD